MAQRDKEKNIDVVAGYTGQMMSKLFIFKEDEYKDDLSDMGFYLGKFIYFMDCYEDLEKDIKGGRYNPLIYRQFDSVDAYETCCNSSLNSFMTECVKSFERLPVGQNKDILTNILYAGVWTKYDNLRSQANKKNLIEKKAREKAIKKQNAKEDKLIKTIEKREKKRLSKIK